MARVWNSSKQPFDWNRSELFLKQLAGLTHRVGFEITGNHGGIEITLLLHREDLSVVETAFAGQFEHCRLLPVSEPLLETVSAHEARFLDFYPPPPYSHLFSTFEEFKTSPLESLLCALHETPSSHLGFYQCLLQPVRTGNNWHANVEWLNDVEYGLKLQSGFGSQFSQQVPSGDLRNMAQQVERKAHNDKPFFAVAVRVGIAGDYRQMEARLRALSACMHLFQHGGRSLCQVRPEDYRKHLPTHDHSAIIHQGQTHRPGFPLNSRELAGLVHIFPTKLVEDRRIHLATLETLPLKSMHSVGTLIGHSRFGQELREVRIPPLVRSRGAHLIASAGMGKSTLMLKMFLQDIEQNCGAVFIDAHGDSVQELLGLVPPKHVSRCIYFNPGDPKWIPLWNPLFIPPGGDIYRAADDLLSALERVSNDWGDRLAHVLRNGLIGLAQIPNATLLDLYHLVRQKSVESDELRKLVAQQATDIPVKRFWDRDFIKDYTEKDLTSSKHKLHPLLAGGSVSLMLSQPESAIRFREIMDSGQVLLVDLSSVGSETREVLGSLILTLFMMAALTRSDTEASARRPFSIFADEAHLFVSADAIENLIAQTRKFGVRFCLAHQYLKQFKSEQVDALSTVGATIIGRLDKRDSQYFVKDLQELVEPTDLIRLEPFEMIARIGTEVVRLFTTPLDTPDNPEVRRRIIERSRKEYCMPARAVRAALAGHAERLKSSFGSASAGECPYSPEDLAYDEF